VCSPLASSTCPTVSLTLMLFIVRPFSFLEKRSVLSVSHLVTNLIPPFLLLWLPARPFRHPPQACYWKLGSWPPLPIPQKRHFPPRTYEGFTLPLSETDFKYKVEYLPLRRQPFHPWGRWGPFLTPLFEFPASSQLSTLSSFDVASFQELVLKRSSPSPPMGVGTLPLSDCPPGVEPLP